MPLKPIYLPFRISAAGHHARWAGRSTRTYWRPVAFADYDFCLNIGGFSNISFEQDGRRIAFDISPVNYVINHYCRQIGLEFDRDGEIARQGNICQELLDELNGMDFYHQSGPKSLGREWVETLVYPMLERYGLSMENMLRTFYEHAAWQISRIITAHPCPMAMESC